MAHSPYIVTGASKGIGRSVAMQIAEAGFPVIALARQSLELDEIGKLLTQVQPESRTMACDLSDSVAIKMVCEQINESTDWIAGIVHNAGTIHPVQPLEGADIDDWSLSLRVNLIGVQDLTQGLIGKMGGASQSRVTTISSGASLRPVESWSAYCVSKAGLDMWTRCLAAESKNKNISAIAVAPGIVDTGMQVAIRSVPPELFPSHADFVSLHTEGHLAKSQDVARLLLPLILEQTMEQSGQRFDVREL
jgi:benzil reductase ((S)-benzoin forming)